ncbi:MAG TPA: hypothetical protein VM686_09110, partial [Polyangiaceae bacterium]|nr:hypothetical protein [Polyangiaceae bacterium]
GGSGGGGSAAVTGKGGGLANEGDAGAGTSDGGVANGGGSAGEAPLSAGAPGDAAGAAGTPSQGGGGPGPISECAELPEWELRSYSEHERVTDGAFIYECRPWPETSWCGASEYHYKPGTGSAWEDAWIKVGPC